jgi:hypothetical protein
MLLGSLLTVSLILYGVYRFPEIRRNLHESLSALAAGIAIALAYALAGWFGVGLPCFRDGRALRLGLSFGIAAGVLFAVSMLCEYLVPHGSKSNERLAWATFGTFFFLLAAAGGVATHQTGRLTSAPPAAVWAALVASQLWFILLLGLYYAFLDTRQEARFLEVDQVIADFERHGARDLRTFIFEDHMGAGFFHSLLAPLLAVPLSLCGGLVARLATLARREST